MQIISICSLAQLLVFYILVCLSSLLVCLHYHLHEAVVAKLHVQQVDMYKGIVK